MGTMKVTAGRAMHAGMQTAYWVMESDDDGAASGWHPLVVVHGGPGCTHDYLLSLVDLVAPGRPVVFYDQIGNGQSTHRPEWSTEEWTVEFFLGELAALLDSLGLSHGYDILGQSWGGMLAAEHAVRRPSGLRRLVIANSPASMPRWRRAAEALRQELPDDIRVTLESHEAAGTIESDEYKKACDVFYARHVCRVIPMPPEVATTFEWLERDPTVYRTMNGPTEFSVIGSLRDWSVEDRLHQVTVPTLIVHGRFDEATTDTVAPFLDRIPDVRFHRFEHSSHMPHWEERDEYMRVVSEFLDRTD